ncbi:MAG: lysophospholipid acyltransferase family protein [Deltaproteobacteria bacterium]|nr:lysophospholipid acyltransferase family protein [Deltaproteobacteria bacterium]
MDNKRKAFLIMFVLRCIPLIVRRAFFRFLFFLYYLVFTKHRLITLNNLSKSFPEKSLREIKRIARSAYANLAITAAEFFDTPFMSKAEFCQKVTMEGQEHYNEALNGNKGILFLSSHFGNWELQAGLSSSYINGFGIIYRRLDNQLLEEITLFARMSHGSWLIPKGRAGQAIRKHLLNNEAVGLTLDQNISVEQGVFVDFFGRPACTAVSLAAFALQTGAPVLPVFMARQKDGRYKFIIKPAVPIEKTGNYQEDLRINTQRFVKATEEVFREYPEQWFWMHQRWKTKKCQLSNSLSVPIKAAEDRGLKEFSR